MEDNKRSLFGEAKPESQVVGQISDNKMFISGDLSSYNLPEEFLKEKKNIPDFAKGCLFTLFCGFLFVILIFMIGLSIEDNEYEDSEVTFFVSDGEEKNISYALDPLYDIEDCYDVHLRTNIHDINFNRQCWNYGPDEGVDFIKKDSQQNLFDGIYPITMYESDIEVGVINQDDEFVEVVLPFTFSNNTLLTFQVQTYWDSPSIITSYNVNESDFGTSFLIELPEYTYANDLDFKITITDLNEISKYEEWFGKGDDCWYYESKCTLTIGMETEVGFLDLDSQIIVITLEKPLPMGTSLEIEYYDYNHNDEEEIMILFLWLSPIIFFVGVGNMVYNKKSQMAAGAGTAVLPVIIIIGIISSIIFEIFF